MAKLKLPFELEKPSSNEDVTQAENIGHYNSNVKEELDKINSNISYLVYEVNGEMKQQFIIATISPWSTGVPNNVFFVGEVKKNDVVKIKIDTAFQVNLMVCPRWASNGNWGGEVATIGAGQYEITYTAVAAITAFAFKVNTDNTPSDIAGTITIESADASDAICARLSELEENAAQMSENLSEVASNNEALDERTQTLSRNITNINIKLDGTFGNDFNIATIQPWSTGVPNNVIFEGNVKKNDVVTVKLGSTYNKDISICPKWANTGNWGGAVITIAAGETEGTYTAVYGITEFAILVSDNTPPSDVTGNISIVSVEDVEKSAEKKIENIEGILNDYGSWIIPVTFTAASQYKPISISPLKFGEVSDLHLSIDDNRITRTIISTSGDSTVANRIIDKNTGVISQDINGLSDNVDKLYLYITTAETYPITVNVKITTSVKTQIDKINSGGDVPPVVKTRLSRNIVDLSNVTLYNSGNPINHSESDGNVRIYGNISVGVAASIKVNQALVAGKTYCYSFKVVSVSNVKAIGFDMVGNSEANWKVYDTSYCINPVVGKSFSGLFTPAQGQVGFRIIVQAIDPSIGIDATITDIMVAQSDFVIGFEPVGATVMDDNFDSVVNTDMDCKNEAISSLVYTESKHSVRHPCVTFIDDDGYAQFYTDWLPIIRQYGIPMTSCYEGISASGSIPSGTVYMTQAQLKEVEQAGGEIITHGDKFTVKSIEEDEKAAKSYKKGMMLNGFREGSNYYVYSNGLSNEAVRAMVSKYFKCAFNTTKTPPDGILCNHGIIGNYFINRLHCGGASYDTFSGIPRYANLDGSSLEFFKEAIDETIENNGWLVLYSHTWEAYEQNAQRPVDVDITLYPTTAEAQTQRIKEIIEYIQELQGQGSNIEIVTVKKGFEMFGNAWQAGDYLGLWNNDMTLHSKKGVAISKEGEIDLGLS